MRLQSLVNSVWSFRPLSVQMADLAAGKKAAAIKAIDDYVKVYCWQATINSACYHLICTVCLLFRTIRNLVLAVEAQ